MSSLAVRTAFEVALGAQYPDLPLIPLENVQVEAPKIDGKLTDFMGTLYFATEQSISIGRKCYRETGTINVLIYRVASKGVTSAVGDADNIRNLFAGKDLPATSPGVRLSLLEADPLTPYISRPGVPTGAYYVGMVAIAYEYDFIR